MNKKWKDIYNDNQKRRYCDVTGIKKENVQIESNSYRIFKEKKYLSISIIVLLLAIILYTFRNDIKILLMVSGFFIVLGILFFVFNYFKLVCAKDGLYVKFGTQQGKFSYEKIKSVYLSKFNDYSFLIPSRGYSIVIRYIDNNNRIKELSFANHFLDKQETINFLNNFNINETENNSYVSFEKFKMLKKIAKVVGIVLFIVLLFVIGFVKNTP